MLWFRFTRQRHWYTLCRVTSAAAWNVQECTIETGMLFSSTAGFSFLHARICASMAHQIIRHGRRPPNAQPGAVFATPQHPVSISRRIEGVDHREEDNNTEAFTPELKRIRITPTCPFLLQLACLRPDIRHLPNNMNNEAPQTVSRRWLEYAPPEKHEPALSRAGGSSSGNIAFPAE